jgi:aspartyl/glutamyl-tRNA(Asn/Gln) amidotransferase C subunit
MDVEELKKVIEICKIKLSENEYDEFIKEMQEIISYFSKIEEIDAKGEELHYVNEIFNPLRDDERKEEMGEGEGERKEKKEKSDAIVGQFTKRDGRVLIAPKVKL